MSSCWKVLHMQCLLPPITSALCTICLASVWVAWAWKGRMPLAHGKIYGVSQVGLGLGFGLSFSWEVCVWVGLHAECTCVYIFIYIYICIHDYICTEPCKQSLLDNSSFTPPFIHSSNHPSPHSFIHSLFIRPCVHSFIHSFIHSSSYPIIHSSVRPFVHSSVYAVYAFIQSPTNHACCKHVFIYSIIHLFHSFVYVVLRYWFIDSLFHLFIALFIHLCWSISLCWCIHLFVYVVI